MNIRINEKGTSKIAIIDSPDVIVNDVQDALDLMSTIQYNYDCAKIIFQKANITENFFHLKTGLAGEILQKYTNYHTKIAILGDFSVYNSKSLNDFIYECNKGEQVFFLQDEQSAIDSLHKV